MEMKRPVSSWLPSLSAACVLLLLSALNVIWAKPEYNWDILPYVAVSYEFAGVPAEEAHARTYALVEKTAPSEYSQLAEGNSYRSVVARDPAAFVQQLPGYRVKVAYPWLIHQLAHLGLDRIYASILISRVGYIAIGLVLLFWLLSWTGPTSAVVASLLLMSLSFALDLAQLSTPDAISTLVVVSAFWLLFEKECVRLPLGLLAASVAVRPDNLLWLFAAAGYCIVRHPHRRGSASVGALAGLILVFALGRWAQLPAWSTVFHHAFVERVPYPETFQPVLSPLGYVRVYLRETHPAYLPQFTILLALIGFSVLYYRLRRFGWQDAVVHLLATVGSFMVSHWLIVPDDDRYFIAAYLMIMLATLRTLVFTREPSVQVPALTA